MILSHDLNSFCCDVSCYSSITSCCHAMRSSHAISRYHRMLSYGVMHALIPSHAPISCRAFRAYPCSFLLYRADPPHNIINHHQLYVTLALGLHHQRSGARRRGSRHPPQQPSRPPIQPRKQWRRRRWRGWGRVFEIFWRRRAGGGGERNRRKRGWAGRRRIR